jgi:hypothetical protein
VYEPGMTIHCMVQEGEALDMAAVPGPAFGEVVGTGLGGDHKIEKGRPFSHSHTGRHAVHPRVSGQATEVLRTCTHSGPRTTGCTSTCPYRREATFTSGSTCVRGLVQPAKHAKRSKIYVAAVIQNLEFQT